jgi:hypothetical protein
MQTVLAASMMALATLTLAAPARSWASDSKGAPAATIALSFKLDPRVLGATYGGERWVSPPTFTAARAQEAVETRARAVDARGMAVKTDVEWSVSDPELLAVSPSRGERVTITAKRPGTSTVTVKAGAASRTLTVTAEKPDGVWRMTFTH